MGLRLELLFNSAEGQTAHQLFLADPAEEGAQAILKLLIEEGVVR